MSSAYFALSLFFMLGARDLWPKTPRDDTWFNRVVPSIVYAGSVAYFVAGCVALHKTLGILR